MVLLQVGIYCIMAIDDYPRNNHQELIMVQLDLEKAYNHVNWSFVSWLMHTMGFRPHMSRLIDNMWYLE